MASITIKDIPAELHARLSRDAEANHRSLMGETLRRLELSYDFESAMNSARDAKWVQEALDSGPEEPLSRKKFNAAVANGLHKARTKTRAL